MRSPVAAVAAISLLAIFGSTLAEHPPGHNENEHYKGGEHDKNYDHEAFLGKDTAHEFDSLSPEKSKERLAYVRAAAKRRAHNVAFYVCRKLVPKMDINGDGFIEEEELKV